MGTVVNLDTTKLRESYITHLRSMGIKDESVLSKARAQLDTEEKVRAAVNAMNTIVSTQSIFH